MGFCVLQRLSTSSRFGQRLPQGRAHRLLILQHPDSRGNFHGCYTVVQPVNLDTLDLCILSKLPPHASTIIMIASRLEAHPVLASATGSVKISMFFPSFSQVLRQPTTATVVKLDHVQVAARSIPLSGRGAVGVECKRYCWMGGQAI